MKSSEEIKRIIRHAFFETRKGQGIGLREAAALDDWATEDELIAAREKDIEEHWWDVIEEVDGQLGIALSFTDREGFIFLLPETMCKALDGSFDNLSSVEFHLCISKKPFTPAPHHGHPEYTEYLRSIHPKEWVKYFEFTPTQVHAIAIFLRWADDDCGRDRELEIRKTSHLQTLKYARLGDYTLTVDDEVNNYDEERRILNEWLNIGGVPIRDAI